MSIFKQITSRIFKENQQFQIFTDLYTDKNAKQAIKTILLFNNVFSLENIMLYLNDEKILTIFDKEKWEQINKAFFLILWGYIKPYIYEFIKYENIEIEVKLQHYQFSHNFFNEILELLQKDTYLNPFCIFFTNNPLSLDESMFWYRIHRRFMDYLMLQLF